MSDLIRKCDKCGAMADVTREKNRQTVKCPACKHRTVKYIIKKGPGG